MQGEVPLSSRSWFWEGIATFLGTHECNMVHYKPFHLNSPCAESAMNLSIVAEFIRTVYTDFVWSVLVS